MKTGQTTLYRAFDPSHTLLYVGISLNAMKRLSSHKRSSGWYFKCVTLTLEHFETRIKALKAEQIAIKKEKPLYNIQGNNEIPAKVVEESKSYPDIVWNSQPVVRNSQLDMQLVMHTTGSSCTTFSSGYIEKGEYK